MTVLKRPFMAVMGGIQRKLLVLKVGKVYRILVKIILNGCSNMVILKSVVRFTIALPEWEIRFRPNNFKSKRDFKAAIDHFFMVILAEITDSLISRHNYNSRVLSQASSSWLGIARMLENYADFGSKPLNSFIGLILINWFHIASHDGWSFEIYL